MPGKVEGRRCFMVMPPSNSFNPTLASEAFIIKLAGFCYLACSALASGGLIRALGTRVLCKKTVQR